MLVDFYESNNNEPIFNFLKDIHLCRYIDEFLKRGYDLYEERNPNRYIPMRNIILNEVDYVFPCSKHGVEYIKNK